MALKFCFASRWATRKYLNLSAGFAGDDRGRGKHCVFFMAVKDVRNGSYPQKEQFSMSVMGMCRSILFYV